MQACVCPVRHVRLLGRHLQIGLDIHSHTGTHTGVGGTMTEPEIQAIYWPLLQPRPTARQSRLRFLVLPSLKAHLLAADPGSAPNGKAATL